MSQEIKQTQQDETRDWQLFNVLLRRELEDSHFIKVENNFLYVKKGANWRLGLPSGASDFRKASSDGRGYQPMLYGVQAVTISEKDKVVDIKIKFSKGGERTFLYKFLD
jgi:competence protein ComGF